MSNSQDSLDRASQGGRMVSDFFNMPRPSGNVASGTDVRIIIQPGSGRRSYSSALFYPIVLSLALVIFFLSIREDEVSEPEITVISTGPSHLEKTLSDIEPASYRVFVNDCAIKMGVDPQGWVKFSEFAHFFGMTTGEAAKLFKPVFREHPRFFTLVKGTISKGFVFVIPLLLEMKAGTVSTADLVFERSLLQMYLD